MTSMYLAMTHTLLENKLYTILVRFPHCYNICIYYVKEWKGKLDPDRTAPTPSPPPPVTVFN